MYTTRERINDQRRKAHIKECIEADAVDLTISYRKKHRGKPTMKYCPFCGEEVIKNED